MPRHPAALSGAGYCFGNPGPFGVTGLGGCLGFFFSRLLRC